MHAVEHAVAVFSCARFTKFDEPVGVGNAELGDRRPQLVENCWPDIVNPDSPGVECCGCARILSGFGTLCAMSCIGVVWFSGKGGCDRTNPEADIDAF